MCLSILSDFADRHREWRSTTNEGWTTAYTVQTILLSIISMVTPKHPYLDDNKQLLASYSCKDCGHSTVKPYPPLCVSQLAEVCCNNNDHPSTSKPDDIIKVEIHETDYGDKMGLKVNEADHEEGILYKDEDSSCINPHENYTGEKYDDEYVHPQRSLCNECVGKLLTSSSQVLKIPNSSLQTVIITNITEIYDYISKEQLNIGPDIDVSLMFGFGISLKSCTGSELKITTPCEYVSNQSFTEMLEIHGSVESTMREELHIFLPLYLHPRHGAIIRKQFIESITLLGNKSGCWGAHQTHFGIIRTLSALMSSCIKLFSRHVSYINETTLKGLFQVHQLFIWALQSFPQLQNDIDNQIEDFIIDPSKRTKSCIPELSNWIMVLALSSKA